MKERVLASLLMLFVTVSYANDLSFKEALELAHKSEEGLNKEASHRLLSAQGKLMGSAMPSCFNKAGPPPDFSIVVQINESGKVVKSWLNTNTSFTSCFQNIMVNSLAFTPKDQPFFTAIEYTNK